MVRDAWAGCRQPRIGARQAVCGQVEAPAGSSAGWDKGRSQAGPAAPSSSLGGAAVNSVQHAAPLNYGMSKLCIYLSISPAPVPARGHVVGDADVSLVGQRARKAKVAELELAHAGAAAGACAQVRLREVLCARERGGVLWCPKLQHNTCLLAAGRMAAERTTRARMSHTNHWAPRSPTQHAPAAAAGLTSRFSGLMSRCTTPWEWHHRTARTSCHM